MMDTLHWSALAWLEGKTVKSVSRSDGDCGLRLTFHDRSYLEFGYGLGYGDTFYRDLGGALRDVMDFEWDDPFDDEEE